MTKPGTCEAWLKKLRHACGLNETDEAFEWRGESFMVRPSVASERHVTVYVWVAELSAQAPASVLRQLLWLQLQVVSPSTPVFGCELASNQLVVAQSLPWEDLTTEQALSLMVFLADLAAQARSMLDAADSSDTATGAAAMSKLSASRRSLPRWFSAQPT